MASHIKQRGNVWWLNLVVPATLRSRYGGKRKLEQSLQTRDRKVAEAKAQQIAGRLKLEALGLTGNPDPKAALLRRQYEEARAQVLSGEWAAVMDPDDLEAGVEDEIDEIIYRGRERSGAEPSDPDAEPELDPFEEARMDGLMDGLRERTGERPLERRRYEPPFSVTAGEWLAEWKRQPGRAKANTAAQYEASLDMFAQWWRDKPMRAITAMDAANYVSHLTTITAGQARHRKHQKLKETQGQPKPGLSPATIRRHVGTLSQAWKWAKPRLGIAGDNPWGGDVKPRKPKRPPNEYQPWSEKELRRLLIENRPRRRDVYEACLVALHTGMRVGEVADLTWGDVETEDGVTVFRVADAKTQAGKRAVPVHSALGWLLKRRGADSAPIWPAFNPEGPGESRGDDLSRLFGAYKRGLGYDRTKAFHSFRKNVAGKLEGAFIPQNVIARLIGHEPGFTVGTYNPPGLTISELREVVNRINYGALALPDPDEVYESARQRKDAAHG